jgi:hypothetical protein
MSRRRDRCSLNRHDPHRTRRFGSPLPARGIGGRDWFRGCGRGCGAGRCRVGHARRSGRLRWPSTHRRRLGRCGRAWRKGGRPFHGIAGLRHGRRPGGSGSHKCGAGRLRDGTHRSGCLTAPWAALLARRRGRRWTRTGRDRQVGGPCDDADRGPRRRGPSVEARNWPRTRSACVGMEEVRRAGASRRPRQARHRIRNR